MGIEMNLQIRRYSGDGTIRTCGNLLAPGYAIEFPKFEASRPYSASYRLVCLPRVHDPLGAREPIIYLGFWNKGLVGLDQVKKSVTASFRVDLAKTSGQLVHSSELPLASVMWGDSQGLHLMSDLKRTKLHFEKGIDYILTVNYTPGLVPPPAKELFFTIKDCAEY